MNKTPTTIQTRIIICFGTFMAAIILLGVNLVFSTSAARGQSANGQIPPRWIEFPVSEYGRTVEVYKEFILWAENDIISCKESIPVPTAQSPNEKPDSIFAQMPFPPGEQFGGYDYDICFMNTQTGQIDYLFDNDTFDFSPRMDGDWIVFLRGLLPTRYTIVRNIISGQEITLTLNGQEQIPNIHNDIVVYKTISAGTESINTYDLNTQQVMTVTTCYPYCFGLAPDIDNGVVVWEKFIGGDQGVDILGYDLNARSYFTISDKPGDERSPRIANGIVVWKWESNIYAYDLTVGQRMTITNGLEPVDDPAVSENLIVWVEGKNFLESKIMAYDLKTGQIYQVSDNPTWEDGPEVYGNLVGFNHYLEGVSGLRKMTEFLFQPIVVNP